MQNNKKYQRLNDFEREEISRGVGAGKKEAEIARTLGRHRSTIGRELRKNEGKPTYRAFRAKHKSIIAASGRRKGKSFLKKNQRLREYVAEGILKLWSPREIVIRLKKEYPYDISMRISHEAIYRYIYVLPRGTLKKTLIAGLRQERAYRRKRKRSGAQENRGKIQDMLSIEERPKEVEDRSVPGHWEGDLIVGKYKRSALGTLVERTTRYTILVPLKRKDAASVRKAYAEEFKKLPNEIAKTLTYDQGKEMSEHRQFTIDTGIQVYFAHPGSPWERGTNENTNGLIRQYFP
ncbi:MAG: IS30 family transposase, partial [Patescibacteria group bacterium]